ncbi:MFS transporter [Devosia rhodophyticola]|uniref:MFS transporter n=1 Tax=Devosia rhodophyticola TaxID=3026423 RepID=A0ABY7YUU9_9HYPH|nr:MFS transporter [Devosia rhodophyticola]WDR04719.1 MFS transporter [Devosia rhodophyticola]
MSATEAEPAGAAAVFCPANRRRFVLIAAILASSMGFIDGSVISIAIPAIRADLGATLADAQWISNGYMLFLSSLILLGGATGDRFGLRLVFGLGIGLFVLASIASALAPTPTLLIAARAIQGLGAAFMVPGSLAIIAKAYPRAERGRAIGVWAAAASLTTIMGPIIGGALLTWLGDWGWRLVFAVNLPLGGIALWLLWTKVPADEPGPVRHLDVVGGVLASVGLLALVYGLTGDGSDSVPALSHTLMYGTIGVVILGAFLIWEARIKAPMLPLRLFASKAFSGAQALTFVLYFSLSGVLFFLPMTVIVGWGATPAEVALVMLPFGAMLTVLSSLSGRLADRFGAGWPITIGAVLVSVAFAGLGYTAPWQLLWLGTLPSIMVLGIGMGLVVSPLSTAVMTSIEDGDTGVASGINNAVSRVAGLLAVAMMGPVVTSVFEQSLGSAAELAIFFGLAPEEALSPANEALRVAATNSAFATTAYITAALSLASALIAWWTLERKPLNGRP